MSKAKAWHNPSSFNDVLEMQNNMMNTFFRIFWANIPAVKLYFRTQGPYPIKPFQPQYTLQGARAKMGNCFEVQ